MQIGLLSRRAANLTNGEMTHIYFITDFEKVLEILFSTFQNHSDQGAAKLGAAVENDSAKFVNAFGALTVEDISSEDEDLAIAPELKMLAAASKQTHVAEQSEEDWLFDIYCFYSDLNEIRVYLLKLWTDYKDGKVDLMVCCHPTICSDLAS